MSKQEEIWDTIETHKSLFVLAPSLKAIFLFILLGPPLGGFAFWMILVASSEIINIRSFGMLLMSLPFTYVFGGIQALILGGIAAATLHWHVLTNFLAVLLATTLVVFGFFYESSESQDFVLNDFLQLLAVHLISVAICLLVSRRYWGVPAK